MTKIKHNAAEKIITNKNVNYRKYDAICVNSKRY